MSDERKWETEHTGNESQGEKPSENESCQNTVTNPKTPEENTEKRVKNGKPMSHPYSRYNSDSQNNPYFRRDAQEGSLPGKDEKKDGVVPPRYGYYKVHENNNYPGNGAQPPKPPKKKKNVGGFWKKAGASVALAVIFGAVAGVVFFGVSRAVQEKEREQEPIANTEILPEDNFSQSEKNRSGVYSVADVAQASMPSVVAITSVSVQEIPDYFSIFGYETQQFQSAGSGSGIIVGENEEELLIATNNHVVEGATTLSVCFIGNDVINAEEQTQNLAIGDGDINVEDAVSAKIKGTDADNDLAVVAVEKSDIPDDTMKEIKIAQLGNSDNLIVGEQVVAIGNALGYGQSVTSGWVSALNRGISTDKGVNADLIQTDAAINPGNSGGALLNMKGEVVGINSAKYADNAVEGMGYAIPISKAQPILENLMNRKTRDKVEDGKTAYLGVNVAADLSPDVIQMYNIPMGAFVVEVVPGEAAEEAGLKKSDIIEKLDGQKVSGREDLLDKLQYYEAGETVEVVIARANDGEYEDITVEVTLGERPSSEE